ncbi:D-glycero-alpha-D-manno-heptose-1,7-bisphosphate 7-phosphatase [Caldimonas tepidiphila]|uniref:D-glycero-alpha-D-manno-heptose-1,7-bisphosphate 7-phosphatase n=1 Tax=Caldimonas tepidiphila TaxID=2315841 RepID=UPI000E5B0F97|nr:HAD family hydrolase [Caldimonas tepidiphila]
MALMPEARGPGRPAIFLDKDGTLVEDVPYNVDPALLRFTPRAVEALRLLAGHGYALVVVTNQPGIALGRFDAAALGRLQAALTARLADAGVHLEGFHACPHAPEGPDGRLRCTCRKPAPGLLQQAARQHGLDLARSWMVGDILNDIEAGRRAGCRTVLLDVGNETEWLMSPLRTPHRCVRDLMEAARSILASDRAGRPDVERNPLPPGTGSRAAPIRTAP